MHSTRKPVFVALLIPVLLAMSACVADPRDQDVPSDYVIEQADRSQMPPEIKAIYDSGHVTIGAKFDQPLTGLRDPATGRIEGFDAEIGRILAQRIFGNAAEGENLFFVEAVPSKREQYLADGTVDMVVATYTMTDERRSQVDFAGPYFVAGQSLMTRKGSDIKDVEDLAGKPVCAAEGSTSLSNIAELVPSADISRPQRDYSSCRKGLLDGTYEAVTTDDAILYGYVNQDPEHLTVTKGTFTEEPYGIGLPKGSSGVRDFINDTLQMAFENGDWAAAFSRTLEAGGVPVPDGVPDLDRY